MTIKGSTRAGRNEGVHVLGVVMRLGRLTVSRATLIAVTVAIWMIAYLAFTAISLLYSKQTGGRPADHFELVTWRRVWAVASGVVFSFGMYAALGRTGRLPVPLRLLAGAGIAVATCFAYWAYSRTVGALLFGGVDPFSFTIFAVGMTSFVWYFLACAAAYFTLSYAERLRRNEQMLALAQRSALEAEIRMLRYQINPHFLFNTLNAISTLVLKQRTGEAERMLSLLSNFLRTSLYADGADKVTVEEELGAQRRYLEIEQVRFPDRLDLKVEIGPGAGAALVPSFILQPIVENSIRHGVAQTDAAVTIALLARRIGERVELTVTDDAVAVSGAEPTQGIGLRNVRDRLASLYGEDGLLGWRPLSPKGFEVVLTLPFEARCPSP